MNSSTNITEQKLSKDGKQYTWQLYLLFLDKVTKRKNLCLAAIFPISRQSGENLRLADATVRLLRLPLQSALEQIRAVKTTKQRKMIRKQMKTPKRKYT